MLCGKSSNNCIDHLHGRALRLSVENQSSFEHSLKKVCPVSTNHRRIHLFAIEINKFKNNISTSRMFKLFEKRNLNCGRCSQTDFSLHSVNTVIYGLRSLKYFAGKI